MMSFIASDVLLIHCVVYCILIVISMIPVGLVNPRMMLQDYPKEIQVTVPPKTPKERMQAVFFALPILLIMIGYPVVVSWHYRPGQPYFIYYFSVIWSMMLVFNIFDLLILDWLMFCYITPKFIVIPGTEGHAGYKNYRFHFIGFLKGIFITGIISTLLAGLLSLF
ncbi:MAG: nitroreductase [Bacteroidota bacterium]